MSFIWPKMLWLLILTPLLVFLYIRIHNRRMRLAAGYGGFGLTRASSGTGPGLRRHIPALLFLAGIVVLLVAMARPQMKITLPRLEGTVILAFDVSGSMAAEDLNPTRMEAAKSVAKDFVLRQPPAVQVGVVAFSESGFSVQPPTNDQEAILASLNRLQPQRGTSLANGILASLDTFSKQTLQIPEDSGDFPPELLTTPTPMPAGTYAPAVIVLLTDGENTSSPDPLTAIQFAADRGVRIHTIGIGSAAGTSLEVNGFTVFTRLDEPMLRQISEKTGGTYYNAANEEDLRAIYQEIDPQLVVKPENMEATALFAGASILILLAGGICSLLWFNHIP